MTVWNLTIASAIITGINVIVIVGATLILRRSNANRRAIENAIARLMEWSVSNETSRR